MRTKPQTSKHGKGMPFVQQRISGQWSSIQSDDTTQNSYRDGTKHISVKTDYTIKVGTAQNEPAQYRLHDLQPVEEGRLR
jgi:hypothetical protein